MRKEELYASLNGNKFKVSNLKSSELANIMRYVKAELKLDEHSFDYYYEIDVNELVNSQMPSNDFEDLKNEGWFFNETKEKIILFLT